MNSPLQDMRIFVMGVASGIGLAIARSMISASGKVAMPIFASQNCVLIGPTGIGHDIWRIE